MDTEEKLTAIIVDDESGSRNNLRLLLENYCPEVTICGLAEDAHSGLQLIRKEQPDVLFLDIEMPRYNGFNLIEWLPESELPEIVFTTAYEQYAIRAFQVSAIGYLLKPIDIGELRQAIERVLEKRNRDTRPERIQQLKFNSQGPPVKLAIPHQDGYSFVAIDRIVFIEANRNYSYLHTTDTSPRLVSRPLKDFEQLFAESGFFRPHRSYLVNLRHVREYVKKDGGYLLMSNGQQVDIAQDHKQEFLDLFQHFK